MTEGRTINTGGGDYREINVSNGGQYAEGDMINHLSGAQQQTLAEAAAEIQELETITELEAKLLDRIRKMSIEQQYRLLQFINESFPELAEETPEPEL